MIPFCAIIVDLSVSTSQEEAAASMLELAEKLDVAVKAYFNGVSFMAYPGESVLQVVLRYERLRSMLAK